MKQWLSYHPSGFLHRDCDTGMAHGNVRWPDGRPPTPFGCRRCGAEQRVHGRRNMAGQYSHCWERPTEAQIKARMLARRSARRSVCRCPLDDEPRPFAPVFDPYRCEADDCHGYTSEMDPFGGGSYWRSVYTKSAEVSRQCDKCGWRTSVWHVDDGSAEEELYRHIICAHSEAGEGQ